MAAVEVCLAALTPHEKATAYRDANAVVDVVLWVRAAVLRVLQPARLFRAPSRPCHPSPGRR